MKKTLTKENIQLECEVVLYPDKIVYEKTILIDEKRPIEVLTSNFDKDKELDIILEHFSAKEVKQLEVDLWQSMKPC